MRWRFDPMTSVILGDTPLELHTDAGGRYVELNHTSRSMVHWKWSADATSNGFPPNVPSCPDDW
jgi:hypothetical protein